MVKRNLNGLQLTKVSKSSKMVQNHWLMRGRFQHKIIWKIIDLTMRLSCNQAKEECQPGNSRSQYFNTIRKKLGRNNGFKVIAVLPICLSNPQPAQEKFDLKNMNCLVLPLASLVLSTSAFSTYVRTSKYCRVILPKHIEAY